MLPGGWGRRRRWRPGSTFGSTFPRRAAYDRTAVLTGSWRREPMSWRRWRVVLAVAALVGLCGSARRLAAGLDERARGARRARERARPRGPRSRGARLLRRAGGRLRRAARASRAQIPGWRRARHGLCDKAAGAADPGAGRRALGFPGVGGCRAGRFVAGEGGPYRRGVCQRPRPSLPRRLRPGDAGRCAGMVRARRIARGVRRAPPRSGHLPR